MKLVCVHMCACACTCARACVRVCVRARTHAQPNKIFDQKIYFLLILTKKFFWTKNFFWPKNFFLTKIYFNQIFFDQKIFLTNFFSSKPPKNFFWPKNFFFTKKLLDQKKNCLKKQKNINCAETLISSKHQPRRRATFPEGP